MITVVNILSLPELVFSLEGCSTLVVWVTLLFNSAFSLAASSLQLGRASLPVSAVVVFDFV